METVMPHGFPSYLTSPVMIPPFGRRRTAAASGVSVKAAHLRTPCWVKSTPAWVCMFSRWPTELSFHAITGPLLWTSEPLTADEQDLIFLWKRRKEIFHILLLKMCDFLGIINWIYTQVWDRKWTFSVWCVLWVVFTAGFDKTGLEGSENGGEARIYSSKHHDRK